MASGEATTHCLTPPPTPLPNPKTHTHTYTHTINQAARASFFLSVPLFKMATDKSSK